MTTHELLEEYNGELEEHGHILEEFLEGSERSAAELLEEFKELEKSNTTHSNTGV